MSLNNNNKRKYQRKERIGMIHYTLPPAISGVEMVIRDHARLLTNYGYKIYLLGASGKKFRSEIDMKFIPSMDPKSVRVRKIQNILEEGKVVRSFVQLKNRYKKIIRRWILKNELKYIIVHNVISRHYNLALTAAITELADEESNGCQWITWVHDASFVDVKYTKLKPDLAKIYPWCLLADYNDNFTYVTISNTRKKELLNLYGKDKKITVIYNGIDLNKMLPLSMQMRQLFGDILEQKPNYIGVIPVRIAERKNIEYAIEFARIAKEQYKINIIFLVTGALHMQNIHTVEYVEYLRRKMVKNGVENNLIFLYEHVMSNGVEFDVYKLNIRDIYLISDFLFLMSKSEGFGLPIIEAGFMRTPIFVSNIPVFQEVGNGYVTLIDLKDPVKKTVEKVLTFLKGSKRTKFHNLVIRNFSLEIIVTNQLIKLLQETE